MKVLQYENKLSDPKLLNDNEHEWIENSAKQKYFNLRIKPFYFMYSSFIYFLYLFVYFKWLHMIQWFELTGKRVNLKTRVIIPLFI